MGNPSRKHSLAIPPCRYMGQLQERLINLEHKYGQLLAEAARLQGNGQAPGRSGLKQACSAAKAAPTPVLNDSAMPIPSQQLVRGAYAYGLEAHKSYQGAVPMPFPHASEPDVLLSQKQPLYAEADHSNNNPLHMSNPQSTSTNTKASLDQRSHTPTSNGHVHVHTSHSARPPSHTNHTHAWQEWIGPDPTQCSAWSNSSFNNSLPQSPAAGGGAGGAGPVAEAYAHAPVLHVDEVRM